MGYDCTSYFPEKTFRNEVVDFLYLLGYKKGEKDKWIQKSGTPFYFWSNEDYKYITGIYAELHQDEETGQLCLWTRTTVWRSKFDSDFHNYTIKQLRKRFGGYFESDFGRNRYFKYEGYVREKAEAGLYRSFSYFSHNFKRASHFVAFAELHSNEKYLIKNIDIIDAYNPKLVATNLLVPFLISIIEEFFRSSYIALLTYSEKREKILLASRLQGGEILSIANNEINVMEALAKWMNFQDLNKIHQSFKQINPDLDIHGSLKRPYRRRKETFWDLIQRLISQRHRLIHQADVNIEYFPDNLANDMYLIEEAIWRVYNDIIKVYNWSSVEQWEF